MKIESNITFTILAVFSLLPIACKEDANKDFAGAETLTDGQLVEGRTEDTDLRYYKFDFTDPGLVTLNVDNAKDTFKFFVFDTDNATSLVAETNFVFVGDEYRNVFGPFSPGTHYIAIQTEASYDKYNFSATFEFSDKTEINNTFDKSATLLVNQQVLGKVLAQNDNAFHEDVDLYKFSIVDRPTVVQVIFQAPTEITPSDRAISFAIFNKANENTFLEQGEAKQGQTQSIWLGPLDVGEHFLAINYGGECDCQSEKEYVIKIMLDTRDQNEPNDIPAENATSVKRLDQEYKGTFFFPNSTGGQDIDWFKFEPTETDNYTFVLAGAPGNACTEAQIFKEYPGNNLLNSLDACNGLVDAQTTMLTAGIPYWIKVQLADSDAESLGVYSLKISK